MPRHPALKWLLIVVALLAVGALLAFAGLQWAARSLKQDLLAALGPESSVGDVRVGFTPLGGLSNVPRRALLGAMADDSDRITVNFTLSGDLDDPTFSLSEELSFKTAAGLLKGMGIGFEALIRALFIILSGFGSALGGAAGA